MRIPCGSVLMVALTLFLIGGCGKRQQLKEAQQMAARARILEDQVDSLAEAVKAYREVATRFSDLPEGKAAQERADVLAGVQEAYRRAGKSVTGDSALITFCKGVLALAPDYRPAIRRLGGLYHGQIDFLSRFAASPMGHSVGLMNQAWSLWRDQDSLWSHYGFQPRHEDREWGDRLCRSSQAVADMLSKYDRYADASAVIERGIAYAGSDGETARARVYQAYYHFWLKEFDKTTKLAQEAIDSGLLEKPEKAKALHAQGMGYAYLYMDTKKTEDLDRALKSLNESLQLDRENPAAKELLVAMRDAKVKVGSSQ